MSTICTRLVIDWETGAEIEREDEEYFGPVAMCKGGGGKGAGSAPTPPAPSPPPEPVKTATTQQSKSQSTTNKRLLAAGLAGTNKTGSQGLLSEPQTAKKSLLGQ